MLHIVRSNTPFTVILLFVYALIINANSLFHPVQPELLENSFVYNAVLSFFDVILLGNRYLFTIVAVVSLFGQALFLNHTISKYKLVSKSTYFIAFAYLSLTSLYPPFSSFTSALIVNWLLIGVINNILALTQTKKPKMLIYNAGLMVGVSTMINFSSIGLILFLYAGVLMLRSANIKEFIVMLFGVFTPIYFLIGISFLTGTIQKLAPMMSLGFTLPSSISDPIYIIGLVSGITILFVMGAYVTQKGMSTLSVSNRRAWTALSIGLLVSILIAIFSPVGGNSSNLLFFPILAVICSNAYSNEKNKAFSNIAFYLTLALVIFCQVEA